MREVVGKVIDSPLRPGSAYRNILISQLLLVWIGIEVAENNAGEVWVTLKNQVDFTSRDGRSHLVRGAVYANHQVLMSLTDQLKADQVRTLDSTSQGTVRSTSRTPSVIQSCDLEGALVHRIRYPKEERV